MCHSLVTVLCVLVSLPTTLCWRIKIIRTKQDIVNPKTALQTIDTLPDSYGYNAVHCRLLTKSY